MTTDPEPEHDGLDLEAVRSVFEASTDFTVGIEEEFAILDPATLDLAHRFEEMREACLRDPELAHSVKGELIDTEIEIRSGRGETFAEPPSGSARRRERLFGLADEHGPRAGGDGDPSVGQLPRPADHRHASTTAGCEGDLRWVAQRNNTWSLHVHVGVRGADRAVAVCDHLRELLPPLLALSANSPFLDRPGHRPALGAHARSSRGHSRAAASTSPSATGGPTRISSSCWSDTDSIVESTQLWWSVRPHHCFGTVEVRICDAQTRGDESFDLAALITACVAQSALDLRRGRGAGRCASARSRRTSGGRSGTGSTGR